MQFKPLTQYPNIIDGPSGSLEIIVDKPDDSIQKNVIAVCCHPHSLHGGSMTNKVVHMMSKSLLSLGVMTIRFNFRGVGKSEGDYAEGIGEQDDVIAVVRWLREQHDNFHLWLGGFSFGAYVSAMVAHQLNVSQLISIAPPVKRFDFSTFVHPQIPWLVTIGSEDELVELDALESWIQTVKPEPSYIKIPSAGHFFHGCLVELKHLIETQLSNHPDLSSS